MKTSKHSSNSFSMFLKTSLVLLVFKVNTIKDNPELVTAATVDDVLSQLSTLTDQQEQSTYSGELEVVTSTLEVIATIDYTNITLTETQNTAFLETTSNLLDPKNAESWQAIDEQSFKPGESSGASKVLDVVSYYTDAISKSLDESELNRTINVSNIVLQVRKLNNSKDIVFPSTDEFENISAALDLSQASLKGSTKYSAVVYKNLTGVLSTNASFGSQELELGSSVMSVKLNQWKNVTGFKITVTFQHFQTRQLLATCSYRNESRSVWERDGCRVMHSNSSETICECDHLTNFAILMSPWTENNVDTEAIRILSIAGCSVSMLCLVVTVLTHLFYWRYVKSDRVKILMNLCIALLVSYGVFLGGVDRTSNQDVCTTIAVLLQYIYLVVFFLMLAEGIEISVVVLYVFTTKSRLKWILPSAWLFPALIVGISLAATQTKGYGNEKSCWLSIDDGVIWAFVGPALLIILVNFILIVLVMKAIFKTKNLSQKSNKERTIAGVRCLCVLLPLVGCTWVIGIFYVNEDMAWIQYVFAICNGLQGMAIFIFHCALNTQIRNAFNRKQKYSQSASTTRSTSNPLLIPRAKPNLSSTDLYLSTSYGESIHQRRRRNEDRRNDNLEMKQYSYTLDYFD
ncbi:adhesion G protein-coupled receptor L2-like [Mercenaria mercenaria]|uniref:adhesion G protein-coupled receptor L2-like n=1 Tax=Mercenaria mercenaria TaxID=6596 RepID=UPI00234ED132|nr:adhesion G protein-coupled receptor L2-like [Mercenaria mercenaria]